MRLSLSVGRSFFTSEVIWHFAERAIALRRAQSAFTNGIVVILTRKPGALTTQPPRSYVRHPSLFALLSHSLKSCAVFERFPSLPRHKQPSHNTCPLYFSSCNLCRSIFAWDFFLLSRPMMLLRAYILMVANF